MDVYALSLFPDEFMRAIGSDPVLSSRLQGVPPAVINSIVTDIFTLLPDPCNVVAFMDLVRKQHDLGITTPDAIQRWGKCFQCGLEAINITGVDQCKLRNSFDLLEHDIQRADGLCGIIQEMQHYVAASATMGQADKDALMSMTERLVALSGFVPKTRRQSPSGGSSHSGGVGGGSS